MPMDVPTWRGSKACSFSTLDKELWATGECSEQEKWSSTGRAFQLYTYIYVTTIKEKEVTDRKQERKHGEVLEEERGNGKLYNYI